MKRLPKYMTEDPKPGNVLWEMAYRRSLQLLRKGRYVAGMLTAAEVRDRAIKAARADWSDGR